MKTDPANISYTREKRVPHVLNEMLLHLLKTKPDDPLMSLMVFLQSGEGKQRLGRDPSWWPKEDRRPQPKAPAAAPGAAAPAPARKQSVAAAAEPKVAWPLNLSVATWPRAGDVAPNDCPRSGGQWPHTLSNATWPRGLKWPHTLSEKTWKRDFLHTKPQPTHVQWPHVLSGAVWDRPGAPPPIVAPPAPMIPCAPGEALGALHSAAKGQRHLKYLDPHAREPGDALAALEGVAGECKGMSSLRVVLDMAGGALKSAWPHNLTTNIWPRVRGVKVVAGPPAGEAKWPDNLSSRTRPPPGHPVVRRWPQTMSYDTWPRPPGAFGRKDEPAGEAKWPMTLSGATYPRAGQRRCMLKGDGLKALSSGCAGRVGIDTMLYAHSTTAVGASYTGTTRIQGASLSLILSMGSGRSLRCLTQRAPGASAALLQTCAKKQHAGLRALAPDAECAARRLNGGVLAGGRTLNEGRLQPKSLYPLHGGVMGDGGVLFEGVGV